MRLVPGGFWTVRTRWFRHRLLRRIAVPWCKRYLAARGSFIGVNATFADVPTFPHGLSGIFISNGAHIGAECVIFHQVTIGSNTLADSSRRGAPVIGRNCLIGAGAMVIGKVVVGDNVRIGANCVVTRDVPANSVVVAAPVRVLPGSDADNSFTQYGAQRQG